MTSSRNPGGTWQLTSLYPSFAMRSAICIISFSLQNKTPVKWNLHERQPTGCPLKLQKMAVNWAPTSGAPAAESRSWMLYLLYEQFDARGNFRQSTWIGTCNVNSWPQILPGYTVLPDTVIGVILTVSVTSEPLPCHPSHGWCTS